MPCLGNHFMGLSGSLTPTMTPDGRVVAKRDTVTLQLPQPRPPVRSDQATAQSRTEGSAPSHAAISHSYSFG